MKKKRLGFLCLGFLCMIGMTFHVEAESYVTTNAPDTFVTNSTDRYDNSTPSNIINNKADAVLANQSIVNTGSAQVIDYHTQYMAKVFCIDRKINYTQNQNYKKSGKTVDPKIVYIITHAHDYQLGTATGSEVGNTQNNDYELSWMTQMAIWQYQNVDNFAGLTVETPTINESSAQYASNDYVTYSRRAVKLWQAAQKLVAAAKGANTTVLDSIQFAYDGKYTTDKNAKTIKTSMINALNLGSLKITLDTSKMPAGTKIYNEAGQEISQVDSSTKFYFVIPVNNINNYSIKAKITATVEKYEFYQGYEYVHATAPTTHQPLVLVVKESKPITGTLNIDASRVEDTEISISSSIYFVGFIILLCGAGIIYANVRPKRQTNE